MTLANVVEIAVLVVIVVVAISFLCEAGLIRVFRVGAFPFFGIRRTFLFHTGKSQKRGREPALLAPASPRPCSLASPRHQLACAAPPQNPPRCAYSGKCEWWISSAM